MAEASIIWCLLAEPFYIPISPTLFRTDTLAALQNGKSLLPSGIIDVQGRFSMGSAVVLKNGKGKDIAVGLVNYRSDDLLKIKGARTSAIEAILGYKHDDEVIHRDNLVSAELLADHE